MPIDIQNPTKLPRQLRLFYSWQSDLSGKTNQYLIKKAIQSAFSRITQELPDELTCNLDLDSAVDGRSGSPDIANVIFDKIATSDVVVADVSIVAHAADGTGVSNPNVMIELGYAAAKIGWERIICVCNETFGRIEELPFDIRSRRMSPYSCTNESEAKRSAVTAGEMLYFAIRSVIEYIDHGIVEPSQPLGDVRRERDIRTLIDLLTTIVQDSFDRFEERASTGVFWYNMFFYWEGFRAVVNSTSFRLYDPQLQVLARTLHDSWNACLEAGTPIFRSSNNPDQMVLKEWRYFSGRERRLLQEFNEGVDQTVKAAKALYSYVHDNYQEIDLREMDRLTAERLARFIQ